MTTRTPTRALYDLVIELDAEPGERPPRAFVFVKKTYSFAGGAPRLVDAVPLCNDYKDDTARPLLRVGCDYWRGKEATDVLIQGSAFAPEGQPSTEMTVSVQVGKVARRTRVFGERTVGWTAAGGPRIGKPEPFTEVAMTYANAYGGVDPRVRPVGDIGFLRWLAWSTGASHPGGYPRNAYGKGYVVGGPLEGLQMPQLEDPDDLLTEDRLVVRKPDDWYKMPRPSCLEGMPFATFPRITFGGPEANPWFLAPDDARLPEVVDGTLRAGYASSRPARINPRFFQDAPADFVFTDLKGGEPVRIEGMHPERRALVFNLPDLSLPMVVSADGKVSQLGGRLSSIIIAPDAERFTATWAAPIELGRCFIMGVHKHIPIQVSVDGDEPVAFEAPPTFHDIFAKAAERA